MAMQSVVRWPGSVGGVARMKAFPDSNDIQVDASNDDLVFGVGRSGALYRRVPTLLVVQCYFIADTFDRFIFLSDADYTVKAISEVHSGAAETETLVDRLQVEAIRSGAGPNLDAGMIADNAGLGFNLKGPADTLQQATLVANSDLLHIRPLDQVWVFKFNPSADDNSQRVVLTLTLEKT